MTADEDERSIGKDSERLPPGELRPDDRGQDELREELEESMGRGEPRPLTREEREAAARDPGPAKTVYAPASERVSKPPLPADEKLMGQSRDDAPMKTNTMPRSAPSSSMIPAGSGGP